MYEKAVDYDGSGERKGMQAAGDQLAVYGVLRLRRIEMDRQAIKLVAEAQGIFFGQLARPQRY